MSPRTPVIPLALALALWAVGVASTSRGLERRAEDPAAPAAWGHDPSACPGGGLDDAAGLAAEVLAAGDAVTPAEARRIAEEAAGGPFRGGLAGSLEPFPPASPALRPSPGSPPGPLYLRQRSLRC